MARKIGSAKQLGESDLEDLLQARLPWAKTIVSAPDDPWQMFWKKPPEVAVWLETDAEQTLPKSGVLDRSGESNR